MSVKQSLRAEDVVLRKLSSFFKVSRKHLIKEYLGHPETGEDIPIFTLPFLASECNFGYHLHCVEGDKINVLSLLIKEKYENSELKENYEHMYEYTDVYYNCDIWYCLYLSGEIWVVSDTIPNGVDGYICLGSQHLIPFCNVLKALYN